MKYFLISLFAFLLVFSSCDDDDTPTDVSINFKTTYEGSPMLMLQSYPYDDIELCFERFNYYVSDITFIREDNTEIEFSEVDWIDFTEINEDIAGAENGITLSSVVIPEGKYKSLKMGIGVNLDDNATLPEDYSVTHPLGQFSEYWAGWESYIFAKLEGKADTAGIGTCTKGFVYHIGSDPIYREIAFNTPFEVVAGQGFYMGFEVDVKDVLEGDGTNPIDVAQLSGTHNPSDLDFMNQIADNLANAFKMALN